jgi:cysteine-rich repeat protein
MGVEECDDGNSVSGDGCSDQGKVEFSSQCFLNPDPGALYACMAIDQSSYIHDTIANMCGYITYTLVAGALIVSYLFVGKSTNGAWQLLFGVQLMRTAVLMQYPLPANLYSYLTTYTKVVSAYPDFFADAISMFFGKTAQWIHWSESFEHPL